MKKITIITILENVAKFYKRQIEEAFNQKLNIETIWFKNNVIEKTIQSDVVLISSPYILEYVKNYLDEDCDILFPNMTISQEGKKILDTIPKNTTALLVNNSNLSTVSTISLLYQIGYKHINFIPYYPNCKINQKYNIAITPNEVDLVPDYVDTIYNIGDKIFDITTLADIASKLEIDKYLNNYKKLSIDLSEHSINTGFEKIMRDSMRIENQLEVLFNYMNEGIIGINNYNQISLINDSAYRHLNIKKKDIIGYNYNSVWSNLPFEQVFKSKRPIINKLIKRNDIMHIVNIYPITNNLTISGALCIFNNYLDTEKTQIKLRNQVIGKGHNAIYNFDYIVGNSEEIKNVKNLAKNMAKSNASIMIYGESGTGKELFAQSIHNESLRKSGPFVAINCAALPEQLLESELFGYEEGAFTGAKKGGKQGLFELAHKGTLFLDEIGEMPMKLQSRLLRVIQERKIMHIGGDYLINIDIRIIGATNKNLRQMTKVNKFRKDLFYRLNVLYLNIPPLRDRKTDIEIILNDQFNILDKKVQFTDEALYAINNYSWEGNVRELFNCVEYLCFLDKSIIDIYDLPKYITDEIGLDTNYCISKSSIQVKKSNADKNSTNTNINNIPNELEKNVANKEFLILSLINDAYNMRQRIGRKKVYDILSKEGYLISENNVRDIIKSLELKNYVIVMKGRAGTIITEIGKEYLNTFK